MAPTTSIAIADKDGRFLLKEDAVLPIYSLTKPYIAAAIFAAEIDIREPISTWFDPSIIPRCSDITVGQLLNHTSGLSDYGGLSEYANAISSAQAPWSDDVFAHHTLLKPLLFEPGSGWSYSNPGYWLLSQIIQKHCGADFDEALRQLITNPLALDSTYVAHGQFAQDLPLYPAEWVWHGLLMSTASDVVQFMRSDFVKPLLRSLVGVPYEHPLWHSAHYGLGLMIDPGVRYGHNGDGPNYSASCFHFIKEDLTACVLKRSDEEGEAMKELLDFVANHSYT